MYSLDVQDAAITDAVLTATQPTGATPVATTVTVDGRRVPATTVTVDGDTLVMRLGAGANATTGGTLGVGTHTVAFDLAVAAPLPPGAVEQATLAYDVGPDAFSVSADDVPLASPDLVLAVPPGSGEDGLLPLGDGEESQYGVELTNPGADVAAATLTIDIPDSLAIDLSEVGVYRDDTWLSDDDDGGYKIPCTTVSATQVTCRLGAVAHGVDSLLLVPITTTAAARYHEQAPFTITATPDAGVDANPGNNSVTGTILFTGAAHLRATARTTNARVTVGHVTTVRVTMTNFGPDPADNTVGLVLIENATRFHVTAFSGPTTTTGAHVPALGPQHAVSTTPSWSMGPHRGGSSVLPAAIYSNGFMWLVGTLQPGQTRSAVVTLKAIAKGTTTMALLGDSDEADPACRVLPAPHCQDSDELTITAVAPVPPPHVTPAPAPSSGDGTQGLAATGPSALPRLTVLGLVLLVTGAGVSVLARPCGPRRPRRAAGSR